MYVKMYRTNSLDTNLCVEQESPIYVCEKLKKSTER